MPADLDLARLRGLLEKADPLPWKLDGNWLHAPKSEMDVATVSPTSYSSVLMLEAVNALPALLAAAEENARLRERFGSLDGGDVWFWLSDENDDPKSLTCPVVMDADVARKFAAAAEENAALLARLEAAEGLAGAVQKYREKGGPVPVAVVAALALYERAKEGA